MGVLPEDVRLAATTDVWLPTGQYDIGPDPYRYHEFNIIGRLKRGIRIEQAQAELTTLNDQQQKTFPDTHQNFGVLVTPLQDPSARRMRAALLMLLGAVGLVLLVACANFVNLLIARNAARQRELATRVALGASRSQLLSHLLTESVLLSLLGGACGMAFAAAGLRVIRALVPPDLTGATDAGLNIGVLAFTLLLSFLSGIGCGLIPALQTSRLDIHSMLKEGARTPGGPQDRTDSPHSGCFGNRDIDTDESNPTSRLLLHILASAAEFERKIIRERTLSGHSRQAKANPENRRSATEGVSEG